MPCLSGKFESRIGLLVNVGVARPGTFAPGQPAPPITTFPALVDTGASTTCIAHPVAQAVGLRPVGMRPMVSATGAAPVNVYLADLVMPFGSVGHVITGTQLMEFTPHDGSPFQILLGRDLICQGTLHMSFDGHFTICL